MIPKIIHQTYISIDKLKLDKPEWDTLSQECKEINSEFQYMFWNDDDIDKFVSDNFNWFLPTFNSFQYKIQKIDAVRYMILYTYGGLYLDMDIKCLKSFSPLFETFTKPIYLPETSNVMFNKNISNMIMASVPNHIFWINVLKEIQKRQSSSVKVNEYIDVMTISGPLMLNDMYKQSKDDIGIISEKDFTVCNICNKNNNKEDVYAYHISSGSWNGSFTKILNLLYCMCWVFLILVIFTYYGLKNGFITNRVIAGFIIGIVYFFLAEGGRGGESYSDKCWKRKQNDLLRHNKVYLFVILFLYIDHKYSCSTLKTSIELLLGAWIGLHLTQDIIERNNEINV